MVKKETHLFVLSCNDEFNMSSIYIDGSGALTRRKPHILEAAVQLSKTSNAYSVVSRDKMKKGYMKLAHLLALPFLMQNIAQGFLLESWIFDSISSTHPCDEGLECLKAYECTEIEILKSAANLTTSLVAREALEQELESLRCHDFSLDDIFADDLSGSDERYCCKRNSEIEKQCSPGSNGSGSDSSKGSDSHGECN